jgi:hypothetical protein
MSDTDSINSEDEMRIETEILRHNSEDNIDHGPVLQSLRQARQKELEREEEERRLEKAEKKRAKGEEEAKNLLDELTDSRDEE